MKSKEAKQYKIKSESLQYIKEIETLIGLGDTINIKARLIHLKRKIHDDLEAMEEYASQRSELTDEEIESEAMAYAIKVNDYGDNDIHFQEGAKWVRDRQKGGKP